MLVAELTAASAGRDRAHEDIARLLEYFEFCLSEIGRLDDRIDSDVRNAVERFENEVHALKDRSADTSAQLQSIRNDQHAFVEIANDRALHASEVFAELQRFELDTRSAADAAAIDLAELADRLRVEHDDRIQALRALSSDEATARAQIERSLGERVDALLAGRDDLRRSLDELISDSVGAVNHDVQSLMERLARSDESLAELRVGLEQVAGRDVVDSDDYAVLVEIAEQLEQAVDQAAELADEALTRSGKIDTRLEKLDKASRKNAKALHTEQVSRDEALAQLSADRDGLRAELVALIGEQSEASAVGRVEDRAALEALLSERVAGLTADRDSLRVELENLVAEQADGLGEELSKVGDRLSSSDEALDSLRRAVDEVAGRDAVDVTDYESLVLLAADLEMRLGQVDSQMTVLDDEARKQASATDELAAGRVEDREQLESLIAEQSEASSADRDGLRAELVALIGEQSEASAVGRVEDRAALEALLSERVAGLTADRDSLRVELENLVAEQADGLGEELSKVGDRLSSSDEALDSLRRAVDEVAGRDAVDVTDYESLVLLAADLEMRLGQVDSQMTVLDDEARKQASATDELAAGRVEDREQLSDLLAEQADAMSNRHDDLRSELDELIASRSDAEERLVALDESSRKQTSTTDELVAGRVEDREALEALIEERAGALEVAQAHDRTHMEALVVERVAAVMSERDELREELDALVRERVEALVIDREDIRSDLDRLVVERTGELGVDIAALDSRLVESDQMVDELRSALDDVANRDVVARSEYEAVAVLAGDLDVAVAEARLLADQAIDRSNQAEASSDARHEQLVEQMDAAQSLADERDARHAQLAEQIDATRSLVDERHEQITEQVEAIDTSIEEVQHELVNKLDVIETDLQKQSRALLDAAEETVELAIKAADKAESAADNADGIRADHDAALDANREEFDSHSERIELIEERETVERRDLIEVDRGFREEIETLVERLVDVERAVAEGPVPDRPTPKPPKPPKPPVKGKGGNLIDLREPEAEKDRKFKRRGRW